MPETLPDPNTVRTDPCPEGYRYEWVPEPVFGWLAWRIIGPDEKPMRCRELSCDELAVAKINRGRKKEQWWRYCPLHMFGRRISGQRVWVIHTIAVEDES